MQQSEPEPVPQPVEPPKAEATAPAEEELPPLPEEPPVTSEAPPPWDEPTPAAPPQREAPPALAQEVPAVQPQPEPKPEYTADPALNKPRKVAAEGINPFPQWAEVIKLLQEQDPMLYTYLKKSKGYFDGTRVLIDGGKTFRDFIRANKESQKLIKKLIAEAYSGEKLVLIENEFGEINIDGGFLKESGIEISEMSAGCICCSLVGDFNKALKEVVAQYHPDRILIEPSGVGKLSDVIVAVERTVDECPGELTLNSYVTVADASKVKVYMKNFGEFYNNQIEAAGTIILSRTQKLSQEKLEAAAAMLREKNPDAAILTTPWDELDGKTILSAVEKVSLSDELLEKMRREHEIEEAEHEHEHHHHHDHNEHDEHDYEHEHHHDHDEDEHDHEHGHHHDHDHDEHDEHEHHHHHHHDGEECDDPECECHHHHHHHADDVFSSWGKETPKKFSKEALEDMLHKLDSGDYGHILRAKGIVNGEDGWLEFDYVPEEHEVRAGHPDYTGRLCVIGAELKEHELAELFGV